MKDKEEMSNLIFKIMPQRVNWKVIYVFFIIFSISYITWLSIRTNDLFSRAFFGNMVILIPIVTATVLLNITIPLMQASLKRSRYFLLAGLACLVVGNIIRTYCELIGVFQYLLLQ